MNDMHIGIIWALALSIAQNSVADQNNKPDLAGYAYSGTVNETKPRENPASAYSRTLLFNPSRSQIEAESRGRVTIYDGLDDSDVDTALDTQFGRIDSMMFVRTRHTLKDGSVEEDDDCE